MDNRTRHASRAFTLIELLVVIGIIAILLSVSVAVGFRVAGSGKQNQTESALRILENTLTEYIAASGGNPKPYALDPRRENMAIPDPRNRYVQPVFDGVNEETGDPINSVGFFIAQCREYPTVMDTLRSLPTQMLQEFDADDDNSGSNYQEQPRMLTVMDGWGNPIRYVHPAFGGVRTNSSGGFLDITDATLMGTQPTMLNGIVYASDRWGINRVRRDGPPNASFNDSDGGIPQGGRPYFYSAGPDGDPSTIEDNVYSSTPRLPREM